MMAYRWQGWPTSMVDGSHRHRWLFKKPSMAFQKAIDGKISQIQNKTHIESVPLCIRFLEVQNHTVRASTNIISDTQVIRDKENSSLVDKHVRPPVHQRTSPGLRR